MMIRPSFYYLSLFYSFTVSFLLLNIPPSIHSVNVTDDEILKVSSQIWRSDNKSLSGPDVLYNVKGPRLFEYVNESKLTGTYRLMLNLYDNYEPQLGILETSTYVEKVKVLAFLDAILQTPPITILHTWLVHKGLASSDIKEFKQALKAYWFSGYPRSGKSTIKDSSGFEHVFLGEINASKRSVGGFHNWLFAYKQEQQGLFVYKNLTRSCPNDLISFNFEWQGNNKPLTSVLMRSSPQLELSLFTLCFLTRPGDSCTVMLGADRRSITTHVVNRESSDLQVATAYFRC